MADNQPPIELKPKKAQEDITASKSTTNNEEKDKEEPKDIDQQVLNEEKDKEEPKDNEQQVHSNRKPVFGSIEIATVEPETLQEVDHQELKAKDDEFARSIALVDDDLISLRLTDKSSSTSVSEESEVSLYEKKLNESVKSLQLFDPDTVNMDRISDETIIERERASFRKSVGDMPQQLDDLSPPKMDLNEYEQRDLLLSDMSTLKISRVSRVAKKYKLDRVNRNNFKYDPTYSYVADIEHPTGFQRKCSFTEDSYWYMFIQYIVIILILVLAVFDIDLRTVERLDSGLLLVLYLLFTIDYIMCFITQHIVPITITSPNASAKPLILFIIEFIAIFPIEYFITIPDYKPLQIAVKYKSSLLLLRLMYIYLQDSQFIEPSMQWEFYELFVTALCFRVICASLVFAINDMTPDPDVGFHSLDWLDFKSSFVNYNLPVVNVELSIICFEFIMSFMIYVPLICLLFFGYTLLFQPKYTYITNVHLFQTVLINRNGISKENADMVLEYLKMKWDTRADFMYLDAAIAEKILCHTTQQALFQDRNLYALQHCPMLKDLDYHILRYLAQKIKATMYLKGIDLYKFPLRKESMIYIASGEVHILSAEDNETPILKLTSGTCVGSMCLVRPYRSSCTFQTGTNCEIYELTALDFADLSRHFPKEYRLCVKYIKTKIDQAILLKTLKVQNDPESINKTIMWIKRELHRLLSLSASNAEDHKISNIYLIEDFKKNVLNDVIFTKMNLNALAIKPRDSQYNDLVFIKSTCVWILHPESPLINIMWNIGFVASLTSYVISIIQTIVGYDPYLTLLHAMAIVCMILELALLVLTPINLDMPRQIWVIFIERCQHIGFLLDVISICWSIAYIFNKADGVWYVINLRLWRLLVLYRHVELNEVNNLLFKQFAMYVIMQFLLWVNFGVIYKDLFDETYILSYRSLAAALDQIIINPKTNITLHIFPSRLLYICISSLLAGSYFMIKSEVKSLWTSLKLTEAFKNSALIPKNNLSLTVRLHSFLTLLINDYQYLQLRRHNEGFMQFPDYIEQIIKPENLLKYMLESQFLNKFPKALIEELAAISTIESYYQTAMIITRGVCYNNLFILIEGQVCSVELDRVERVEKGADLNCLEVMLGIPTARHFVAFSYCIIVSIDYKQFLECAKKFPKTNSIFLKTIENVKEKLNEQVSSIVNGKPSVVVEVSETPEIISFFKYKCLIFRDSFEAYDFFPVYDSLGILSCVRFLLLRVTFHPEGTFFLTWEKFRITTICIGSILYLIPYYLQKDLMIYLLAFDVIGLIDIYIRLHVCYYNKDGILVKHPLLLAKHYMVRSFLTDLIAILPVEFCSQYTVFISLFRSLRCIQLYRLYGFANYSIQTSYWMITLFVMFQMLMIIVGVSTLVFELHCSQSTVDALICPGYNETNVIDFYLTIVYMTTTDITGMSSSQHATRSVLTNPWIERAFSLVLFLSVFWEALSLGRIFTAYLCTTFRISAQSIEYSKLLTFMKSYHISQKVQDHVVDYFYARWFWVQKNNIDDVLIHMNISLKRDLLFHVYGDPFIRFNHFSNDYRNIIDFYKSIFIISNRRICPTYGKFVCYYDVNSEIYLLYRGMVDIIGPNRNLMASLLPGAIFGNLLNSATQRQLFTATAKCNTLCLCLKSSEFMEVLESYPAIKINYFKYANKNSNFIKSKARGSTRYRTLKKDKQLLKCLLDHIMHFHLLLVCYLGNLLNCYQIAVKEDNFYFLLTLYILDIYHVIAVVAKYFRPVKNDSGIWCVTVKQIYKVSGSWTGIFFDILTSLPLDLISYNQMNGLMYTWLRVNRLARIYYVCIEYNKLVSRFVLTQMDIARKGLYICYEIIFFSSLFAALFIILDVQLGETIFQNEKRSDFDPKLIPKLMELTSQQKFYVYLMYLRFVTEIFVIDHSSYTETESGIRHLSFSVLMLICFVFRILIICHFYGVVYDTYARQSYIGTIMFNTMLKYSKTYTAYIKTRYTKDVNYVFNNCNKSSIRALQEDATPMYLIEVVLNSCFGNYLTRHPLFKLCHADFLRQVGRCFKIVHLLKGFEVIHKYDQRKCMFFVLKGFVVALENDDDIIENYLFMLRPGDCFCFRLGMNQEKEAPYTYTCIVDCMILELEYEKWENIVEYFPATKVLLDKVGNALKTERFLRLVLPRQYKLAKKNAGKKKNIFQRLLGVDKKKKISPSTF